MTLLCMPIFDKNGQSIGVAQMINKINGLAFTQSDVDSFEVPIFLILRILYYYVFKYDILYKIGVCHLLWPRYQQCHHLRERSQGQCQAECDSRGNVVYTLLATQYLWLMNDECSYIQMLSYHASAPEEEVGRLWVS